MNDAGLAGRRRDALRRLLAERGLRDGAEAPIEPHPDRRAAPLSYPQHQLWLFEQMFPGTGAYNVPAAVRLTGPLDVAALQAALDAAVARHGVLRATFALVDGQPEQRFGDQRGQGCPIRRHDLTGEPATDREERARALATTLASRRFDLVAGPLVEAHLIAMAPADHVLLLTMHHLVGDAWSWGVLLHETAAGYEKIRGGDRPSGDHPAAHYGDVARWQRNRVETPELRDQLSYWRERLAGSPPPLQLPTDRPRPAVPAFNGGVVDLDFGEDVVRGLRRLASGQGTSLFVALLAALDVLLYRYTGASDITVATSVANRGHPQTERMVGLFVNTVLLRARVTGRLTYRELLRQVGAGTAEALAHQEVPFEKVVETLRAHRAAGGAAAHFLVMCTMRAAPTLPSMGDLRLTDFPVHNGTSKRDLTLNLVEQGDRVSGQLEYDTALFDRDTIVRLADHLRRLCAAAVAAPDTPVARLPMLGDADRRAIADLAGPSASWPDGGTCVHELFAAQAARTPDAIAVRAEDARLTFAELDRLANRLAHLLQQRGVGPEHPVGVCVDRSPALAVAVLGTLKAGGAYVPIDPAEPAARRTAILREAGATVLVHTPAIEPPAGVDAIELNRSWLAATAPPAAPPTGRAAEPTNAAYILFTSGSTGAPKGVVVEHRQLVNYTLGILDRLGVTEPLSYAMVQPLTVDSCLTMLVPPLITGGVLHLISRERALDADALADYLVEHRVDCLKIAPSHLKALLGAGRKADLLPRRHLVVGGEASNWAWLREVAAMGTCQVENHYGPTETTVGVFTYRVTDRQPDTAGTPLGRPLANTGGQVLDHDGQPVPIGVPGELYVSGANVARGYLRRPDLTAAAFVPDPHAGAGGDRLSGGRLYRTGDVVRIRPDGGLEFLGRRDDQVKIRGFRIELGEIESVLTSSSLVREAAVVVRRDRRAEPRIIAYVVGAEENMADGALLEFLRERLPPHMVPAAVVPLAALPLSAHGKVERDALPPPPDHAGPITDPRDETERAVAAIWCDLLDAERVGIDQNFFDLGGDSLLLITLHQRLWSEVGLQVELIELFRSTTVRAQAALKGAAARTDGVDRAIERGRLQHRQLRRRQGAQSERRP
ncbi:amino acid adenylation domain-containing protein [Micromonospora sp. FIMYZ51]|uniref:non-ribosomal peptide synthetase n=1 Tax=Micromonospora sp. FIMYZ51 TaxID=3051832 RepID=UPI003120072A